MPSTRFKTPNAVPPGGIQFRQMEIGWKAPLPLSEDVPKLAYRIQQLRINNPTLARLHLPTNLELIKQEIIDYNCGLHPEQCISPGQIISIPQYFGNLERSCSGCGRSR